MRASVRVETFSKKHGIVESHSLRPYNFEKTDMTYIFKTDKGLRYRAYFIEFPSAFYKLYSFSFDKEEGIGSYDPRVKDTIVTILKKFFDADNLVLGYTCDVTDGRGMARKRLFDRWFEQENDGSLRKIDFQNENIFVSLIVNKQYFAIEQIVNDINQLFVDVLSQK